MAARRRTDTKRSAPPPPDVGRTYELGPAASRAVASRQPVDRMVEKNLRLAQQKLSEAKAFRAEEQRMRSVGNRAAANQARLSAAKAVDAGKTRRRWAKDAATGGTQMSQPYRGTQRRVAGGRIVGGGSIGPGSMDLFK